MPAYEAPLVLSRHITCPTTLDPIWLSPSTAADEVHGDHVERVVEAELELDPQAEEADHAGREADDDRGHTADEAGARRDGDESGDGL